MQYIYFSNISVFFLAFLLVYYNFSSFFFHCQAATCQFPVSLMKADTWPQLGPSLLYCWGSAKVVLYMLASVKLKKRENRDDIDFFTNERLRTLWYLFLPETSACGNKPLCLWCTWCSTLLHSISLEARIYICNLHLWFKKCWNNTQEYANIGNMQQNILVT